MNRYVAFLRGINISGKNKVSMPLLRKSLEEFGFIDVVTYINSGNIIFSSDVNDKTKLMKEINKIILNKFNLDIPVMIILKDELLDIYLSSPKWWINNDKGIYNNLIFAIQPTTLEEVFLEIGPAKEDIEKIEIYKNVIFWSFKLKDYSKTNWIKTASSSINNKVTIRNKNTIKHLLDIL